LTGIGAVQSEIREQHNHGTSLPWCARWPIARFQWRPSVAGEQRRTCAGRTPICYVVGCGVDCHAMNFQPAGVFVQASRTTSLRLRGWPLISASIAAWPVTSAVSPARRTLRSLQAALLYFVFPERREASHVALVSVSPEE